jgi:preprotein translocase subunit Sec61beta
MWCAYFEQYERTKPAIPPDVIVEAVLHFKDRIIITNNNEKRK